jgi:hypothetical protein
MSFGLKNVGATNQRAIQTCLGNKSMTMQKLMSMT